uniref:Formate/nitrite transporter n=1 Tax=Aureoumbra lagunensis TaxID=44058 RepID=A0A7S3K3W4_9STRA|mmetsp:Transcript_20620/g.26706  ORF Transcript_20620/g.26706 Transcript_20620/m.26706 type:complete len:384 (-) Transcript_20620:478-1629(-)|eukprot:CAMPEP_0197290762 /NCGR_PEP_ID=MMETSP0890-20130614/9935_1 /TAXON_ID=44058 ORGANISM="Aureoumbra lagunensis, Strain CCMP1510" /NCGR_SAMPLE_ID=MMETSP0890 /ASSEMBLY_ACC=CAM_ASM_000533 /LENGTH=383 /DNA_ID=CAMNT_0042763027 /DNA_START=60 /DNA_END=1211 /DNA_ORIENTATION=+
MSHVEPNHTTAHTEPRAQPYDVLRYVNVKRVFNTQPEVMSMVIQVGDIVHERMLSKPLTTFLLSVQAGLLLSFGVLMSCQVGGRWGSSTGVNNFVFAGFGIPFGLTFIVITQGSELITANYMFCSFGVLAAEPEDRPRAIKALLMNWFVCWWGNIAGAILHFTMFAWQTGLIKTVKIKGSELPASSYSDPQNTLEHIETIYYESQEEFRLDYATDFCSRSNYALANMCKLMNAARAKCTANFATSILRGWGCNWMVCLAIWLQMCATEPISKFIMIWLPIELFISSGFDHLVVNEFLIPGGIMVGGYYLDHRVNWGNAFFFNFLPVTIGSILGAWTLVFPFWYFNKGPYFIAQQKRKTYKPVAFATIAEPAGEESKVKEIEEA